MPKFITAIIIVLLINVIYPQNYKKVKIYVSNRQEIMNLASSGFALEDARYNAKENSLILFVDEKDIYKIDKLSLRKEILIDDWNKYYSSLSSVTNIDDNIALKKSKEVIGISGFNYGSMGGHYTLQEVNNKLDSMYMQYPQIIKKKFQIGTSVEKRPIYAVKISDNPNQNENEPEVLFTALIHAREPQGMMNLIYYMYYLLENYGKDPEVTYLVNNRQIYFVPIINVDGYEYNRITAPNGGGMWRKNKSLPYGVDLNRNYGYKWGYDDIGSSNDSSSETYRGSGSFSEPETQAIRDLCNSHNFKTALNYHTYGNLLISPWGYSDSATPDSNVFKEFSTDMTLYNKYTWGTNGVTVGYVTNGDSDDWMYGEQSTKNKIISMTPEVGNDEDGFWAPKNKILSIAQENLYPNLYITWVAGPYVNLNSYSLSKAYCNSGDEVRLIPTFKNKGLSPANNITAKLISLSPDISIKDSIISLGAITERSEQNSSSSFSFIVSPSANVEVSPKVIIKSMINDILMATDTISIRIGQPACTFKDTTNNINTLWSMSGKNLWATTTETFYSAPNCYTDSPGSNYSDNSNVLMTLKDPIDLSGIPNPIFTFWTKYSMEEGYDYGQVKFTTDNGRTWLSIQGKYSKLSTGWSEPAGQYVYSGAQSEWVQEEIDLAQLINKKIKVRFELHSDSFTNQDGWYIDDISVVHYVNLPVELISFSAVANSGNVILNWTTASELNNKGFKVQRSLDGKIWNDIGFVNGKGTVNNSNEYVFIDKNPLTVKTFYRLIQIDFNGITKESKPIEVSAKNYQTYELKQNYPNPFNPSTTISYVLPAGSKVNLKIFNSLGQEIETLLDEYQDAGYHSRLYTPYYSLPSGIYFYQIKAGNFIQTRQMLLIK